MLPDAHQRAVAATHVAIEDHAAGAERTRPARRRVPGGVTRVEPALLDEAVRGARQVDAGALPPLEPGVVDADAPTVARRPDARERAGHPDEGEAVALELHLIGLDLDGGLAGHPDDVRREVVDARRIDHVQRRRRAGQAVDGDTRLAEPLVRASDLVVHVPQRRPGRRRR